MADTPAEETVSSSAWTQVGSSFSNSTALRIQVKNNPVFFRQQTAQPAVSVSEGEVIFPVGRLERGDDEYLVTKDNNMWMKASGPDVKVLIQENP